MVEQISDFLENRAGQLSEITTVLYKNNIDIRALFIAETTDYGVLRLIVSEPEKAKKVLSEKEIEIVVSLGDGDASSTAWGCDLTYDYVKINGDYRT